MVFLKLQPYRFRSLTKGPNEKLKPRYFGPYEVLQKVGEVAYKIQLPTSAKIHSVFHVSQLKKQVVAPIPSQPLPTCLKEDLELDLTPESIVDRSYEQHILHQVLVKWKGLPYCENTWESAQVMQQLFPAFPLEDKGDFDGRGIDTSQGSRTGNTSSRDKGSALKVYQRRKKAQVEQLLEDVEPNKGIAD